MSTVDLGFLNDFGFFPEGSYTLGVPFSTVDLGFLDDFGFFPKGSYTLGGALLTIDLGFLMIFHDFHDVLDDCQISPYAPGISSKNVTKTPSINSSSTSNTNSSKASNSNAKTSRKIRKAKINTHNILSV